MITYVIRNSESKHNLFNYIGVKTTIIGCNISHLDGGGMWCIISDGMQFDTLPPIILNHIVKVWEC